MSLNNNRDITVLQFIMSGVGTYLFINYIIEQILILMYTITAAERSFSTLKRVKNYLQNSEGDQKISDLALLSTESVILDTLDLGTSLNVSLRQNVAKNCKLLGRIDYSYILFYNFIADSVFFFKLYVYLT